MLNRTRLRNQALAFALTGLIWGTSSISIADGVPLPEQLVKLGRQAQTQGYPAQARDFYNQALKLDPKNKSAKSGLSQVGEVRQIAFRPRQDGALPPPAGNNAANNRGNIPARSDDAVPPAGNNAANNAAQPRAATIENIDQLDAVRNQQFGAAVRDRQQKSREFLNRNNPEAALNELHQAQNLVRSAADVPENLRVKLERELEASILAATRDEERIIERQADEARRGAIAESRQIASGLRRCQQDC